MLILSWDDIVGWFNGMLISLSTLPFKFVNIVYRIFLKLAETNVFDESAYKALTTNIYRIIAVVMLFVMAYAILLKIVDPDGNSKGIDGKKTLQKFVMAIILIILCPSIFSFAYGLQSAILNSGVIGGIFTGQVNENDQTGTAGNQYGGIIMSVHSYTPFFTNETDKDEKDLKNSTKIGVITRYTPTGEQATLNCKKKDSCSLEEVENFAKATGSFAGYRAFANNWYDGEVSCDWLLALVVGCFLLYVIVSFCFDLGIRVCKLAFFQIIAPIAFISMAIPKMDDIFNKWLKNTTSTFINVFTRVLIMNFGVYLISLIANTSDSIFGTSSTGNGILDLFGTVFLIMGVVAFMKQAPKLLSDLFGIGDGDMKLGIKDKLKAGGAFTAGTMIGGATTGLTRNAIHAVQNYKKFNEKNPDATGWQKFKQGAKGVGSTFAGTTSGLAHGFLNGRKAGSVAEMKDAASKTNSKVTDNRNKRESYKAAHPGKFGVTKGKITDTWTNIKDWAGTNDYESLKKEQDIYNQGVAFQKKLFDLAADNELVLAYEGQKKAAQERQINESDYTAEERNVKDLKTGKVTKKKLYKSSVDNRWFESSNKAMAYDLKKKTEDIKMYDNLIKMAKLKTVSDKLKAGNDLRYSAVAQEFEMFKQQHADIDVIRNMGEITYLSAEQEKAMNTAFSTLNPSGVQSAYDILSKGPLDASGNPDSANAVNILSNTDTFKKESARMAQEISKKIHEEQAKKGN